MLSYKRNTVALVSLFIFASIFSGIAPEIFQSTANLAFDLIMKGLRLFFVSVVVTAVIRLTIIFLPLMHGFYRSLVEEVVDEAEVTLTAVVVDRAIVEENPAVAFEEDDEFLEDSEFLKLLAKYEASLLSVEVQNEFTPLLESDLFSLVPRAQETDIKDRTTSVYIIYNTFQVSSTVDHEVEMEDAPLFIVEKPDVSDDDEAYAESEETVSDDDETISDSDETESDAEESRTTVGYRKYYYWQTHRKQFRDLYCSVEVKALKAELGGKKGTPPVPSETGFLSRPISKYTGVIGPVLMPKPHGLKKLEEAEDDEE